MSFDEDQLYSLLPAIYRLRDAEQGEPLKELLKVIAQQVGVLEEDLARLYNDQFIETCSDWAAPYIGDLIGYRPLHQVTPKISSPRAEVANTMAYRRRKGTAAMLEQMARDVTGWGAVVVEFFQLLSTTQHLGHTRPGSLHSPNLRQIRPLVNLNTPFDRLAHTADMRRRGKYNLNNIGIFLWRLTAYPITGAPAYRLNKRCYLFSPLGHNMQLFTLPRAAGPQPAGPLHVALPISHYLMGQNLGDYYGRGKSLQVIVGGREIPPEQIQVTDLRDLTGQQGHWANLPGDKIAIDPVLGRLAFPAEPPGPVHVTCHYGFSADLGGGEYERGTSLAEPFEAVLQVPDDYPALGQALNRPSGNAVIEITDNGRYVGAPVINAAAGQRIELRAANKRRPSISMISGPESGNREACMTISGQDGAEIIINGLLISGGPLRVTGNISRLVLRHCTLVPGLGLDARGPSLVIESAAARVELDSCIAGGLQVAGAAGVNISNSIIDATSETAVAYAGAGDSPGGALRIMNSTVIGRVHTNFLELAQNTIFAARPIQDDSRSAPVIADRAELGSISHCYLPQGSILVGEPVGGADDRPQFTSLRYGDPGYCQLSSNCPATIRQGADDNSELGVFHGLYQPQRETNLRLRLDEYLRFGLEAGIFFES